MKKPTTYILQRDIPGQPEGTRYVMHVSPDNSYEFRPVSIHGPKPYFPASFVENNPEWFKPEVNIDLDTAMAVVINAGYKITGMYERPPNPAMKYTDDDLWKAFEAGVTYASSVIKNNTMYRYVVINMKLGFEEYLKSINKK